MAKDVKEKQSLSFARSVRHYSSTFTFPLVHQMTKDFGESNTDLTNWKPKVADIRAFLGSPNSKRKQFLYDFPDGKDTGDTVQTFLRSPGLDITEIDAAEKRITQIVEYKKASDADKEALSAQQKELLDTIKGVKDSLSKGDSTSESPESAESSK